jgi:hypothetical protein
MALSSSSLGGSHQIFTTGGKSFTVPPKKTVRAFKSSHKRWAPKAKKKGRR